MSGSRFERIVGVETEFGTLTDCPEFSNPEQAVAAIKDAVFYDLKLGLIDRHARDEVFEPALSGGFLMNGGRLYIDAVGSHLEYATAESRTIKDAIAHDRAGHRIITQALRGLALQDKVSVYNNSVDHFGGHTFGSHENYLTVMEEDFFSHQVNELIPFLVTRQIFAGVGRVGGHRLDAVAKRPSYDEVMANPVDYIWVSQVYGVEPDSTVNFQLSQRADHIIKSVASRVRFNRALINPKWEHFYSHDRMQRLHLLFGESNQMEFAFALKLGTTRLVLHLIEDRVLDSSIWLDSPLYALREISRDQTFEWRVTMADGSESDAVSVQRRYLELAQGYRGMSAEGDWTLDAWQQTLDALARDPLSLGDRLDWVAKRAMVETFQEDTGLDWTDDVLHSIDLEYHNLDPERSLHRALVESGQAQRFVTDLDIIEAMTEPPSDTRAAGRGKLIRRVLQRKNPRFYVFDWNGASTERHEFLEFSDPFHTYEEVVPPQES